MRYTKSKGNALFSGVDSKGTCPQSNDEETTEKENMKLEPRNEINRLRIKKEVDISSITIILDYWRLR